MHFLLAGAAKVRRGWRSRGARRHRTKPKRLCPTQKADKQWRKSSVERHPRRSPPNGIMKRHCLCCRVGLWKRSARSCKGLACRARPAWANERTGDQEWWVGSKPIARCSLPTRRSHEGPCGWPSRGQSPGECPDMATHIDMCHLESNMSQRHREDDGFSSGRHAQIRGWHCNAAPIR